MFSRLDNNLRGKKTSLKNVTNVDSLQESAIDIAEQRK